ncbi:MAG: lysophospholipase L1-like esterase [Planctomycetota bacterium]|jgi:lysophospholipase L1-like esterase
MLDGFAPREVQAHESFDIIQSVNKFGTLIAGLIVVVGLWWVDVVPGWWDIQHAGQDIEEIDAERRNSHREARLATFAVDKAQPGSVLFLGSSTIERMPFSFLFPGAPTVNRGVGDEPSSLLHQRLGSSVEEALWPTVAGVVLYAGALDRLREAAPAEVIADRVDAIVADILDLAPLAEVLVLGLLPQRDMTSAESVDLAATNTALQVVAQGRDRVTFLNSNRAPLRTPAGALATAYSVDRLHLNGDGYQVLSEWIRKESPALSALLFP